MKKTRILAIVPYEEMKNAMERLAAERSDISLTVRLGNITTCASILKEYENSPFDVIISRGGTANLLRSLAVIPVVEITVTIYDILRSLKSVESFTGKFAVVGFENITDCVKQLSAMLQYDVTVCTITERSNIKKELLNLRAQGVELVLCDKISTINAEELGMNSIFIASDDASITAAFSEAVHIASLCRNFKKQNAIMHSLLLAQDFHTLVFDERGTLLFSTPDEGLLAEFGVSPSALAAAFSAQSSRQEREYERGGRYLSVKSSWLSCGGQPCLCLRLQTSPYPRLSSEHGISLSDSITHIAEEVAQTGSIVYMGEISRMITACYSCALPVLILGEKGTGKDTVASIIYRNGPYRSRKLLTIDCQNISKRRFQALLNQETSPFMDNGITVYFRSLDSLDDAQAYSLFSFIDQTRLSARCRLIFSFQISRESGEDRYACDYLLHHFSTVCLRLPPLRCRKDDIPNIATITVHQLNSQLGRKIIGFEQGALDLLTQFSWEGNLSQLSRVIRTAALLTDGEYIGASAVRAALKDELPAPPADIPRGHALINLNQSLREITQSVVRLVMNEEHGNQSRTAERLKICRTTVWNLLKEP